MYRFFKMLVGIALLPLAWALSRAVYRLYQTALAETVVTNAWEAWALPIGFLLWILIFLFLPKPKRAYVFGHELTHALWGILMGARVGGMKVHKDSGKIELTQTNFLITLAPYFFPFYTALVVALYFLLDLLVDLSAYRLIFLGLVGFTWSFHLTFTLHMLTIYQPDVREHGRIFSFVVIYLMNLLFIGLWIALTGTPRLLTLWSAFLHESNVAYGFVFYRLFLLKRIVGEWIIGLSG